MNASQIIQDDMTLEEKLQAIDAAMQAAQIQSSQNSSDGVLFAPLDPSDLTMCESCQ